MRRLLAGLAGLAGFVLAPAVLGLGPGLAAEDADAPPPASSPANAPIGPEEVLATALEEDERGLVFHQVVHFLVLVSHFSRTLARNSVRCIPMAAMALRLLGMKWSAICRG